MENYSIKDLMKANSVRRWHTVDVAKEQSLSEHQWNVTILSIRIAEAVGLSDQAISQLTMKALIHDMDEIWTGDLPSPYKEELKRTGASPSHAQGGIATPIPAPTAAHDPAHPEPPGIYLNGEIDAIIRAADLIDAYLWSRKYVLDEDVKRDCYGRLGDFRQNCHPELNQGIDQILIEV